MSTLEELTGLINAKAEHIRTLKTEKATKEAIAPHVEELLSLKERFKTANGGVPFDPPKEEPKKDKKEKAPEPAVEREGPSKKELNKLAKKEKKSAHKGGEGDEAAPAPASTSNASSSSQAAAAPAPVSIAAPVVAGSNAIVFSTGLCPPVLVLAVSSLLKHSKLTFSQSATNHLPCLGPDAVGHSSISGDANIARYLLRSLASASVAGLYHGLDAWLQSEVDQWLDLYSACFALANDQLLSILPTILNGHLGDKTFVVGQNLSLADVALYVLVSRLSASSLAGFPHIVRWQATVKGSAAASDLQVSALCLLS
jgi:hypothetical protein